MFGNETVYLLPLLAALMSYDRMFYMVSWVRSISIVLSLLFIAPILLLLWIDFALYIFRITSSAVSFSRDKMVQKSQRKAKLYHTNSYFNFNNYVKNFSGPQHMRRNSTDSLNSNDSMIHLQDLMSSDRRESIDKIDLKFHNNDTGRIFLQTRKPINSDHHDRSANVVFSVSP